MNKQKIEISIDELQLDELCAQEQELVKASIEATKNSYADYSHFNVGAALRLRNGRIVQGSNQENAAFTVGICAERAAIYSAQANYPEQPIDVIAICAKNVDGFTAEPISPCGSCRQVMVQIEDRYKNNMTVLLYGKNRLFRLQSAHDLLPLCFVDENMR